MNLKIALLPGDGIGPEVIEQTVKCLKAIEEVFGHNFHYKEAAVGFMAIDKTGKALPDETLKICLESDAILIGALEGTKNTHAAEMVLRPEQGILQLRKELGLYANIRPVKVYPSLVGNSPLKEEIISETDFIIYRELTGGLYTGTKFVNAEGTLASDLCEYTEKDISRIAHLAFKAAKNRKSKITLVDKANVLESSKLWRKVVSKIAESYPEVTLEFMFADQAAMELLLHPKQFDVVLTSNMFGDILADEASVIGGSLGLVARASLGEKSALFEPLHGIIPQEKGANTANPIASILSAAMLLEHCKLFEEAMALREAVNKALEKNILTPDLDPNSKYGTSHVGDFIADTVLNYDDDNFNMNDENIGLGKSTII